MAGRTNTLSSRASVITNDLLAAVTSLKRAGAVNAWSAQVVVNEDNARSGSVMAGRVCALRKSAAAIKLALRKVHRCTRCTRLVDMSCRAVIRSKYQSDGRPL